MIWRLTLLLSVLFSTSLLAQPAGRPNVLFIAIDDLRDWAGYLGHAQAKTPNLDRLAARGVAFARAYCAAPVCNPSRAALMSGLRPFTTGVYENQNDWRTVVPKEKSLTTTFRNAGYFVAGAGKIYHGGFDRRAEWDDYLTGEGKNRNARLKDPDDTGSGGIKFGVLDGKDDDLPDWHIATYTIEQVRKKHDKPFFLACGFHKPHMPWNVPQKWFDLFPLDKVQLPTVKEDDLADIPPAGVRMAKPQGDHATMLQSGKWKKAVQAYLATIAYCDMNVGRVIEALDKSAYKDNTIICLWSDHGWTLGEKQHWRKFALWEEPTRAPFIWVAPGVTRPGVMCNRTVDLMSIYPTLTDLCGIATPAHVDGKSIRPLLTDPQAAWTSPAITTYLFKNHAVRTEDWRYIRYANGDEELYHNARDPHEWINLATRSEYADRKKELAAFLPGSDHPDIGPAQPGSREKKQKNKKN